jgi:hypothetical protein
LWDPSPARRLPHFREVSEARVWCNNCSKSTTHFNKDPRPKLGYLFDFP